MSAINLARLLTVYMIIVCAMGDEVVRVVDLTHTFNIYTVYWPGGSYGYNFTKIARGQMDGIQSWYESNYVGTPEHGGTHLDAPAHFFKGAHRTQQIPMEKLVGPGVVINVKDKVAIDADYRVTVDDLKAWERKHGHIPNGAMVLMNSGWDRKYPNKTLTFGTTSVNDVATFHFPGFHENTADWLVTYRNVHVVGVDTPSTDYGQSKLFPVHKILGEANVSGLENVANLDGIPEHGAMVYTPVMKIFDGSGGPTRAFATFTENTETNTASRDCNSALFVIIIALVGKRFGGAGM